MPNEQIITWLKDAHAMEQSLASVLELHIEAARELPDVRDRLSQHLEETEAHAERVRECLESLGAQPSAAKSIAGGFMGAMQGASTVLFEDQLVKNALADYAMEHFEMACYSSLIAAADDVGLTKIARTCGEILRDEAAMADWLELQIPELTLLHQLRLSAERR